MEQQGFNTDDDDDDDYTQEWPNQMIKKAPNK